MSAFSSAFSFAFSFVVSSAVLTAQEPVAQRPFGTVPVDSMPRLTPEDSARLDSLAQRQRNTRCWRARPMPECRMVFLTDFGFDGPLYTTRSRDPAARYFKRSFDLRLNWNIGLMRNGGRHSHGVSFAVTSEPTLTFPMLAEYRYRQWRGPVALDAGVGFKRHQVWIDNAGLADGRGVTTMLGVSPNRWFGLSLRYEQLGARGTTHRGVLLGIQSTRVSEYSFQFLGIAFRDWLLGLIGFEWGTGDESEQ